MVQGPRAHPELNERRYIYLDRQTVIELPVIEIKPSRRGKGRTLGTQVEVLGSMFNFYIAHVTK
jgi:hypothetical protein